MYGHDDYLALAHLGAAELQNERRKAREAIEHYQAYADKPLNKMGTLPPLQPIIEKIKSCENYIIEIERRLGQYSRIVSLHLIRLRNKKIQAMGVNPRVPYEYEANHCARPVKVSASSKRRTKISAARKEQHDDLEWLFD